MYKYQFTSSLKDLLDAEKAERSLRTMRTPFRWSIVIFGAVWFVIGIIEFDPANPIGKPLVWILAGSIIFYFFGVKTIFKRRNIKKNNAQIQDISLAFGEDCIKLNIGGVGSFARRWEELTGFADTPKGILFYFTDGVVNWLPTRVFTNNAERKGFVEFLNKKHTTVR